MKNFIISEELANQLLAYLAERPFKEVFQMFPKLQAIQPAPDAVGVVELKEDPVLVEPVSS